ncbi:MAG TPA: hypothetical protein VF516_00255 [Kofleriaceae bacterium]
MCGKRGRVCLATTHKPAKISNPMRLALQETFQAELGISRSDGTVARSGIVEAWMIKTSTAVALIDRGLLTIESMAYGEKDAQGYPVRWRKVHQITAAGCAAIGRDMAEIIAWAWEQAVAEYSERCTSPTPEGGYNLTTALPVEVGAVVGWTHKGEAVTGKITAIFGDDATILGADRTGWTVGLADIERVVELTPTCDHGFPVVEEQPSAFEGAPPPRQYADGCQSYGPYAELTDQPRYPEGTPEHTAYAAELRSELDKFAKGEPPYEYGPVDKAAILTKEPIDSLLSGAVEPKSLMALVNDAIAAAVHSEQLTGAPSTIRERSDARAAATAALGAVAERVADLERVRLELAEAEKREISK